MARAFERVRTEPGLLRNTIVLIALITQLVSPWSEAAAAYTRAARKSRHRAA